MRYSGSVGGELRIQGNITSFRALTTRWGMVARLPRADRASVRYERVDADEDAALGARRSDAIGARRRDAALDRTGARPLAKVVAWRE